MNIYVGNLSYDLTDDELQKAFADFGKVTSATIVKDKITGRSKGFGFIEMAEESEANAAIEGLNNKDLKGRLLKVNKAHDRKEDFSSRREPRQYSRW
ncbi:MAG: RNA-binding protein [bacterium]